jgi:small GTP-binding protein
MFGLMLYFIMPTNLPPEYFEAEKHYKEAQGHREKISALEALISTIPKHKGTDKLRADMRKRLSKLRDEGVKSRKAGKVDPYAVQKEGAAQVALMGFSNSGKSSLLGSLTNAKPVIADYPMSTVMPLSGMMPFEDILIQLVDLPPIGYEASDGWVSGIIRNSDVVLMVVDLAEEAEAQAELLLEQLNEWRIDSKNLLIAANKSDTAEADNLSETLVGKLPESCPVIKVSAVSREGLDELRAELFRASGIIRVYSKEPGKDPDLKRPFTLRSGTTVYELAEKIHKDFIANLKYTRLWGSVKIQGQKVQRDYVLKDRDIAEFHI